MNRFLCLAIGAVGIVVAGATSADAQIIYGYTAPAPGGIVTQGTLVGPGAVKTFQKYYSPLTGTVQGQYQYSDVFGRSYGRAYGYNPLTGAGYSTGFVNPSFVWGPVPAYPLVPLVPPRPATEFESFQLYRRGIFPWR